MKEKSNTSQPPWGRQWVENHRRRAEGRQKLERFTTGNKVWIPVALLFLFLCILTWINEIFNLYHHIFGISHIPINWDEALSETIIIAGVGTITVSILIRNIHRRRAAEKELEEHHHYLEETVDKRTMTLQHMIDAMAGRVVRVSDLEMEVEELRLRVGQSGLEPQADLPAPGVNQPPESSLPPVDDDTRSSIT